MQVRALIVNFSPTWLGNGFNQNVVLGFQGKTLGIRNFESSREAEIGTSMDLF